MPFSFRYGLSLMCLTILLTQVCPQCYWTNEDMIKIPPGPQPSCCTETSNVTIHGPVDACFIQEEQRFPYCPILAYILRTKNHDWCVDPRAWWLQQRLKKLHRRGIFCRIL